MTALTELTALTALTAGSAVFSTASSTMCHYTRVFVDLYGGGRSMKKRVEDTAENPVEDTVEDTVEDSAEPAIISIVSQST